MTVAEQKKPKTSSLRPVFVDDDIRRQFLASHMTPFIRIEKYPLDRRSNIFTNMTPFNQLNKEPSEDTSISYDISYFCREHFPDYIRQTRNMTYPQIEFWLEMHRRGFRMTNKHLRFYKNRFVGNRNRNYLHYQGGYEALDSQIHVTMYILLLLEQGYDFTNFIQKVKDIRFDELNTTIVRPGHPAKYSKNYMSLYGFDISTKVVEPVINFLHAASYEQVFLFNTDGVGFTYGSPTPSLLGIERDAPSHLFIEGKDGFPVARPDHTGLVYSKNIFIDDAGQPVVADVETWFVLGDQGLSHDFMLRNFNQLMVNENTVFYYHTRTGQLKESNVPRNYAPKHAYGSMHLHMKDSYSMIDGMNKLMNVNYVFSPDFLNHPAYKYSGIDTFMPSKPDNLDPDKWYPLHPLYPFPDDVKRDLHSWVFKVSQFFLRENSPLFQTNFGTSINERGEAVSNFNIIDLLPPLPGDHHARHRRTNNQFGVLEFFAYYAQNPAIEQVLKDRYLHEYAMNIISMKKPLKNPTARNSLDAVGLDRATVGTIRDLQKIRSEKLPLIHARYAENTNRLNPRRQNGYQGNRNLNGYNYNVRQTLEESFSHPNFMRALTDYFERCEGPGDAFLNVYADYLDYVLEVLPTNLPSLSNILSACSMEFVIGEERHQINISFEQYLAYMRHGVQYQALDFNEFHHQFKDYLSMKVQVHNHTDFEYYPRPSIRLAHDLALRDFNLIRHEHDRRNFEAQVARYSALYTYKPDNEDYVIIAPESPEDVIEEGRNLRHCVGSYVSSITDGRRYIMFLRHKDTPDESYATVEIDDHNNIRQVEGSVGRNRHTQPPDVEAFLRRYRLYLQGLTTRPSMIVR